jgi:two-component system chemotaxis response regulator CheY
MRALIVEDDFTSRVLLQELLRGYGAVHVAVNGREAVDAVRSALESSEPYDLICLDIMMPESDGQTALREIRSIEDQGGIQGLARSKIVMTTALRDKDNVGTAFREQCDGYLVKPIHKERLVSQLRDLGLID